MKQTILVLVLMVAWGAGCATPRFLMRNCQPAMGPYEEVDFLNADQEWVCNRK